MAEVPSSVRTPPRRRGSRAERVDLGQVLARMRRALRRSVQASVHLEPLSEAQLELVLLVESEPGIRVGDAATALGVAANTVSTLVSRLSDLGMIERTTDPNDGRSGRLTLTATAEARLVTWRRHRSLVLDRAMSRLDAADGSAIEAAIPALWRLSRMLEEADGG